MLVDYNFHTQPPALISCVYVVIYLDLTFLFPEDVFASTKKMILITFNSR